MAILDFLFQGSPPPAVTSTTTSQQNLPTWYQEYLRALIGKSSSIAAEEYQPYTGERVARLTPDQTSAYDLTRAGVGSSEPYTTAAGTALTSAATPGLNQGVFDSYMSPYTTGVVDRIAQLGTRNLTEDLLPAVNTTFTGAGQYGGSRHADFTANAIRDTNESIIGAQSKALADAYDSAMSAYGTGAGRQIAAGQGLGALGMDVQGAGLRDAAAMEAIGTAQQGQGQRNLDVAYQDFLAQRDYPKGQADFMSQIVRGLPAQPVSTATTTTGPGEYVPSPVSQLAGLAVGGYGLSKAFGAKEGGRVRRSRIGGKKMKCGGKARRGKMKRGGSVGRGIGGTPLRSDKSLFDGGIDGMRLGAM